MSKRRVFIISGHGNNKGGKGLDGKNEGTHNGVFALALYDRLKKCGVEVYLYDTQKDFVNTQEWSLVKNDDYIIEIHHNLFNLESANGTETWIRTGLNPCPICKDINNCLAKYFRNRGIKTSSGLKNMNNARSRGISYQLIEVCFLTNKNDLETLLKYRINMVVDIADVLMKHLGYNKPIENQKITCPHCNGLGHTFVGT